MSVVPDVEGNDVACSLRPRDVVVSTAAALTVPGAEYKGQRAVVPSPARAGASYPPRTMCCGGGCTISRVHWILEIEFLTVSCLVAMMLLIAV
jgi:hypothetical protein